MKPMFALSDLFSSEEPSTAAPVRQMSPPLAATPPEPPTPVSVPPRTEDPVMPQVGDRVLHRTSRGEHGSGIVMSKAQHVPGGACFFVYWVGLGKVRLCMLKEIKVSNLVLRGGA